ncbi:C-terminal binding protein [Nonomuraea sp. K274]|uniref:C-terminal binding protein n=1 Tax=Nonomuraea cypriaca TaxID=1187855 RepID=A0A931A9W4_9ACTN|nr:NAD(P)-dependent oxidoreductase [Nonomuraea cypriaca]MBF8187680.1 C-terminal binding protein [Nonomuraea cypriaca]
MTSAIRPPAATDDLTIVVAGPRASQPQADAVTAAVAPAVGAIRPLVTVTHAMPAGPSVHAVVIVPSLPVTAADLAALPDLRMVCTASAGYDHVDLQAARGRGVAVARAVGNGSEEVADHIIALTLALLRGVANGDRAIRDGTWAPSGTGARRVRGTRLGLVGFGRIGRFVADRALGLGMEVIVYTRTPPADAPGVRVAASLAALLRDSDVVVPCLPLTTESQYLLDAQALALMPTGSFLVNCARGGLVDVTALDAALRAGRLGGAALDVFESEPPSPDDPVRRLPRTILTPHSAWHSPESALGAFTAAGTAIGAVLGAGSPNDMVEFLLPPT